MTPHPHFARQPLTPIEHQILSRLACCPIIVPRDKEGDLLDLLILLTAMAIDGLVESEYSAQASTYFISRAGHRGLQHESRLQ